MIGDTFVTEKERSIEEKVITSVDGHFVLELSEMEKGVKCFGVAVEERH